MVSHSKSLNFDGVICGHIHKAEIRVIDGIEYMNSGDWVENFTALEYQFKRWKIYNYHKDKLSPFYVDEDLEDMNIKDLIAAITIVKQDDKKTK